MSSMDRINDNLINNLTLQRDQLLEAIRLIGLLANSEGGDNPETKLFAIARKCDLITANENPRR